MEKVMWRTGITCGGQENGKNYKHQAALALLETGTGIYPKTVPFLNFHLFICFTN